MGLTRFGAKSLQVALNKWGEDVLDRVKEIIVETGTILRNEAIARAPSDTGELKRTIEMTVAPDGLTAIVHVGVHYAIYVEYGTGIYAVNGNGRKTPWAYKDPKGRVDENGDPLWIWTKGMAAQPFWNPAVEKAKDYYYSELRKLGR